MSYGKLSMNYGGHILKMTKVLSTSTSRHYIRLCIVISICYPILFINLLSQKYLQEKTNILC